MWAQKSGPYVAIPEATASRKKNGFYGHLNGSKRRGAADRGTGPFILELQTYQCDPLQVHAGKSTSVFRPRVSQNGVSIYSYLL